VAFLTDKLARSRLEALLTTKMECEELGFKEMLDFSFPKTEPDLAKDMMAMTNTKGGYIVIGVTNQFEPKELPNTFHLDEADLNNRINKYFAQNLAFLYP